MASLVNITSLISIHKPHPFAAFSPKPQFLSLIHTTTSNKLSERFSVVKPKASIDEKTSLSTSKNGEDGFLQEETEQSDDKSSEGGGEVDESLKVLKEAAKTRKVKKEKVLAALSVIKKTKHLDTSGFLETLGGTESPGRTWMLIFTSQDKLKRGSYFPITAVQRFDAAGRRIENGVYLRQLGSLTFEGRFSWKKKMLAFVFELMKVKVGPFGPFKISLIGSQKDEEMREPSTKDPFFIWFYVDEEIAVAQGRGGGTAFWCRCSRVTA